MYQRNKRILLTNIYIYDTINHNRIMGYNIYHCSLTIRELQFCSIAEKENMKKTIAELLTEAKELKQKEIALKAEMKSKKIAIASEYTDNLSEEEKQKQIAGAEKILETAKQKAIEAKMLFKNSMKTIRSDVAFAKEILDFVNYKQKNSLPKTKNSFRIEKNFLLFNREGIAEIKIDVSNANWQSVFKAELKKQGINGENRIADNIIYKASQLLKSNIAI